MAHIQNAIQNGRIPTYEELVEAVRASSYSLDSIPKPHRTYELCVEAIKNDINNYVLGVIQPDDFKQDKYKYLCLLSVQKSRSFENIPAILITYEFCLACVRVNSLTLENIPYNFRNSELCIEAYKQNYMCYTYIPENIKIEIDAFVNNMNDNVEILHLCTFKTPT